MLKEVETSIRGKVGLNKRVFSLDFYSYIDDLIYNYADVTIRLSENRYPSLILEVSGLFTYFNMTGYAKYTINRINSFAKTECITNTMPDKCLFVSLIRNDSNEGIFTFRLWTIKNPSNYNNNPINIRCQLSVFDYKYGENNFELLSIVKGYEEPFIGEIVPMIEGDCIIGWCTSDDDSNVGNLNHIKDSDCLKICWPESNPKYKVVHKNTNGSVVIVETENTLYQSWFYNDTVAGVNTIKFPQAYNEESFNYTVNVAPLINVNNSDLAPITYTLLGGSSYRYDSCGIWLSRSAYLDCQVFGYYKNPRFHDCSYLYNAKLTFNDKKNLESNNAFSIYPHLLYIGREDKYAKVS